MSMFIGDRDVGAIGLGTAPLAFKNVSRGQAILVIHAAIDAGVKFIDTAPAYTRPGVESFAEAAVAAALAGHPEADVVVATKGGHRRVDNAFPVDGRPVALRADCERSLRALRVDAIDLYQLHHVDPRVPLVDSVGTLAELQAAGKVRYIGLSNVAAEQIEQAQRVAPIASVQNRLAFGVRDDLPTATLCAAHGIAYLAYMPLGGVGRRPVALAGLSAVAARHGVSVERVQLGWLLAQGAHVMPLVGASRPSTIRDSAAVLALDDADLHLLG
jgi:aryl-alcohol dehydrogenase-like predicted oxidoreductase